MYFDYAYIPVSEFPELLPADMGIVSTASKDESARSSESAFRAKIVWKSTSQLTDVGNKIYVQVGSRYIYVDRVEYMDYELIFSSSSQSAQPLESPLTVAGRNPVSVNIPAGIPMQSSLFWDGPTMNQAHSRSFPYVPTHDQIEASDNDEFSMWVSENDARSPFIRDGDPYRPDWNGLDASRHAGGTVLPGEAKGPLGEDLRLQLVRIRRDPQEGNHVLVVVKNSATAPFEVGEADDPNSASFDQETAEELILVLKIDDGGVGKEVYTKIPPFLGRSSPFIIPESDFNEEFIDEFISPEAVSNVRVKLASRRNYLIHRTGVLPYLRIRFCNYYPDVQMNVETIERTRTFNLYEQSGNVGGSRLLIYNYRYNNFGLRSDNKTFRQIANSDDYMSAPSLDLMPKRLQISSQLSSILDWPQYPRIIPHKSSTLDTSPKKRTFLQGFPSGSTTYTDVKFKKAETDNRVLRSMVISMAGIRRVVRIPLGGGSTSEVQDSDIINVDRDFGEEAFRQEIDNMRSSDMSTNRQSLTVRFVTQTVRNGANLSNLERGDPDAQNSVIMSGGDSWESTIRATPAESSPGRNDAGGDDTDLAFANEDQPNLEALKAVSFTERGGLLQAEVKAASSIRLTDRVRLTGGYMPDGSTPVTPTTWSAQTNPGVTPSSTVRGVSPTIELRRGNLRVAYFPPTGTSVEPDLSNYWEIKTTDIPVLDEILRGQAADPSVPMTLHLVREIETGFGNPA